MKLDDLVQVLSFLQLLMELKSSTVKDLWRSSEESPSLFPLPPFPHRSYSGDKIVVEIIDKMNKLCSEQVKEMKLVGDIRRETGQHIR